MKVTAIICFRRGQGTGKTPYWLPGHGWAVKYTESGTVKYTGQFIQTFILHMSKLFDRVTFSVHGIHNGTCTQLSFVHVSCMLLHWLLMVYSVLSLVCVTYIFALTSNVYTVASLPSMDFILYIAQGIVFGSTFPQSKENLLRETMHLGELHFTTM